MSKLDKALKTWQSVPEHVRRAITAHMGEEDGLWFAQGRPYGDAMSDGYDAAVALLEVAAAAERKEGVT